MSEKDQHAIVIEEIKQTISGLSEEEKAKFEEAVVGMNRLIVTYGSFALLAFAYVGATLALEDSDEGQ